MIGDTGMYTGPDPFQAMLEMGWVTIHMQRGVVILSQLELAVVGYLSWGKCQRGSRSFLY